MQVARDQAHRTSRRLRRRIAPSVLALVTTLGCAKANGQAVTPIPEPQDSIYQKSAQHGLARAHSVGARLRGGNEPTLYEGGLRDAPVAYRFVHSSAFGGGPSLLRLEQRGDRWLLISKAMERVPAQRDSSRVIYSDSVVVPDAETEALRKSIEGTGYWRGSFTCREVGLDGWSVLLEARDRNGYHAVHCWMPDERSAPTVLATMREFNELAKRSFKESPERK